MKRTQIKMNNNQPTSLSRRDFLKLGGLTAVTTTATACSVIGRKIDQGELPASLPLPPVEPVADNAAPSADPLFRLLNRAGYGPRPGDLQKARQMGFATYLDEQLNPTAIEDNALDLIERNLTFYHMDYSELAEQEAKDVMPELIGATLARAVYSKRQVYEAAVEFWSDHFNIYARKNKFMAALKIMDDRDVIRPFALGNFRDLLGASAHSQAMLVYLDNVRNGKDNINENYARELLELHTLGVHAGYTQQDIQEVARVLTG